MCIDSPVVASFVVSVSDFVVDVDVDVVVDFDDGDCQYEERHRLFLWPSSAHRACLPQWRWNVVGVPHCGGQSALP